MARAWAPGRGAPCAPCRRLSGFFNEERKIPSSTPSKLSRSRREGGPTGRETPFGRLCLEASVRREGTVGVGQIGWGPRKMPSGSHSARKPSNLELEIERRRRGPREIKLEVDVDCVSASVMVWTVMHFCATGRRNMGRVGSSGSSGRRCYSGYAPITALEQVPAQLSYLAHGVVCWALSRPPNAPEPLEEKV